MKKILLTSAGLSEKLENLVFEQIDILIFCGGEANILFNEVNCTGFNDVIRKSVDNGLLCIGVSAGSMIAARNLPDNLGYIKIL